MFAFYLLLLVVWVVIAIFNPKAATAVCYILVFLLPMQYPWLIPLVILALLGTLGYTVWKDKQEHTAWENRQSPKVEGYHPNNGWEYIETPTSSETSSQTPSNPQP